MSDDRDDDFRDEKTRVAASLDRTVVRAKSTLNDAFSEKTTVFVKTEPLPTPPPLEDYPETPTPGGAKQIRAADVAIEEDSQLEIEPAPKKEKKKKKKTEGPAFKFNFPKVEPKFAASIAGAIALVALVVWFMTSEPAPKDAPDVADVEATPMEKEDLASLPDSPPPQPRAPVVETDTSTARALENFDMAVRRTQDRARQKVE